jgi:AcrR family transcriptional regulator
MPSPGSPTPQLSRRAREIVGVARQLLEEEGAEGLSTRRLAQRLGIRAPSLYSHFANKQQLEGALVTDGLWELGDRFEVALTGPGDPVDAFAYAFRAFAKDHPHLFRLMYRVPWETTQLDPNAEQRTRLYIWRATGGDLVGARAIWGLIYGLVELELSNRLPDDGPEIDAVWREGLNALKAAMPMSGDGRAEPASVPAPATSPTPAEDT